MDLRQLECFLAVCEELHFSRAAEKLHMSQPSLSRHIRNLEDAVGMPLFDRVGRRTTLTEAGRILLAHARRIFHEMDQAKAAIRDLSGLQRGRLAIGSLLTASYLLPPAVTAFKQAYPNIELAVFGLWSHAIIEKLIENKLDLGITVLPVDDGDIEVIPLLTEELALAVPASSRLAELARAPFSALAREPVLLLPPGYALRRLVDEHLRRLGLHVTPALEISSLDALIRLVAEGSGTTVLPLPYIQSLSDARIAAVRLVDPTPRRTIGLTYRKGKFVCATTRAFIDMLTEGALQSPAREQKSGVEFDPAPEDARLA